MAGTKPKNCGSLKGKAIHVHIAIARQVHGDLPPGRGVVNSART